MHFITTRAGFPRTVMAQIAQMESKKIARKFATNRNEVMQHRRKIDARFPDLSGSIYNRFSFHARRARDAATDN